METNIKEISLDNWIKEGQGFSANSYRNKEDENLLLKLFFSADGKDIATDEYEKSKAVEKLGIAVPKAFEIVKVNNYYGVIYERIINKKSFGKLVSEDPDNIQKYASLFARESKSLHNTKCDTKYFKNRKDSLYDLVEYADVKEEIKVYLRKLLQDLPDKDTCLHGDFQTGNIVYGWCKGYEGREQKDNEENKCYFIDLGNFGYGNPIIDLSQLYLVTNIYNVEKTNIEISHMLPKEANSFWKYFVPEYIGSENLKDIKAFEDKVAPYSMFFILTFIRYCDNNKDIIETAQRHIHDLFDKYVKNKVN